MREGESDVGSREQMVQGGKKEKKRHRTGRRGWVTFQGSQGLPELHTSELTL